MSGKRKLNAHLSRFSKVRVMVVGDVIHDVFIWGSVRRISPEAPVPVVEVTNETSLLGGAANVGANLAALGVKASLAGVVGADHAGDAVLGALDSIKADRSCVIRSKTRPTPVKTRIIAHQQQVVRFDREERRPLKPSTFKKFWRSLKDGIDSTDALIISDYSKGTLSRELMERTMARCRDRGVIVVVDPKPANADWYRGATAITPNNKEASEMAGIDITNDDDLERAAAAIIERVDCENLLITRGEKGMSLFRQDAAASHVPALAREVFDVTGAGDTVIAAFTTALVAGIDPIEAVKLANLAAGIVVGKLGTSVASMDELKAQIGKAQSW